MDKERIERLVLDTLYYRLATAGASCFLSNAAGLQLLTCDSSALQHIEQILRDVVVQRAGPAIRDEFLGLDYVLGAYAIIGSRYDPNRIIAFVRTMPTVLQVEFVAILPIFFRQQSGRYNFDVAPAPELVAFANECCGSDADALATAAERATVFLRGKASPV